MNSRKLSLPVMFADDERDYDTPCYLVSIQSRFASRISDDIDTRAETKALQDQLRAALAQQAQPLTDEMIEDEVARRLESSVGDMDREMESIAKWVRDRLAQQAQPEMPTREQIEALPRYVHAQTQISGNVRTRNVVELSAVLALFAPKVGLPLTQGGTYQTQAQPEMPTRDAMALASCELHRHETITEHDYAIADAVLAVFARKWKRA